MITLQEATTIALDVLEKDSHRPRDEYAFYDEHARCKKYGWVLFFNSRKYVETGDFLQSFFGNGPIVVMDDGSVHRLGTSKNSDTIIAEFEQEHGLS